MSSFEAGNANLSHEEKLSMAYNGYKQDMVEMIFPGCKAQADCVVRSIAEIITLNLSSCDAKDYFDILSIFSEIVIRSVMTHIEDESIVNMLLERHGRFVQNKQDAKRVLTYCRLNMKNNTFNLDDKEAIQALDYAVMLLDSTAKIPQTNLSAQEENLTDPQYGLVPEKPIYARSVEGSREYLSRLRTEKKQPITWKRTGCIGAKGINGLVDIYECFLLDGTPCGTIYINMYGTRNSEIAPAGFMIAKEPENASITRQAERQETQTSTKATKEAERVFSTQRAEKFTPERQAQKKTSIKPIVIVVMLVVMLIGVTVMVVVTWQPFENMKSSPIENIDELKGFPEFYDVQFGMAPHQVAGRLEVKYSTSSKDNATDEQFIYTKEVFELFGIPTTDAVCGFHDDKLEYVMVYLSKEHTTLEQLATVYTQKYGEPTNSDGEFYIWAGMDTEIILCDSRELGYDNNQVVLYYSATLNSKYRYFDYSGPEYDPCGFLSSDIFEQTPERYTFGLIAGEDYDLDKSPYFTSYTFYPNFSFMGLPKNIMSVCLDVDAGDTNIGLCTYRFYLEKDNLVDRITYMEEVLEQRFGKYISCTYTSMYYDNLGNIDMAFEDLLGKLEMEEEGIYTIQWKESAHLVTLSVCIEQGAEYFDASVSISG